MGDKMTLADLMFIAGQSRNYGLVEKFSSEWATPELIEKELSNIPDLHKERILLVAGVKREDYETLHLPSFKGGYIKQKDALIRDAIYASLIHLTWQLSRRRPPKNTQEKKVACPHCGRELKISFSVKRC